MGKPHQCFLQKGEAKKFWAKFSTRFSNGGLLFHNWEEYRKSKIIRFITDVTAVTPNANSCPQNWGF